MTTANLRLMTLNVRHAMDPVPHSWEERVPLIRTLLEREAPDIIGTQECFYSQVKDMLSILPGYDWLGLGRKGGSGGEFMAIFFRKDRFEILEYDHYWLSDTPSVIGSTTWGHKAPRMVTWGRFLDLRTERQFYLCNTHLDHVSAEARVKAAELIVEKASLLDPELPIVITGDFNIGASSAPHDVFFQKGGFTDTWDSAKVRQGEGIGTFNDFKDPLGRGVDWRIDWILTRGAVEVDRIQIVDDHDNGRFPSDHYPLLADLRMG
jgi:endonuclease/exonuclease/phosphatase family metal-dependent hydrolase